MTRGGGERERVVGEVERGEKAREERVRTDGGEERERDRETETERDRETETGTKTERQRDRQRERAEH